MEFYTCSKEKRPVRLTQSTRKFAWESLHGKYGDEAVKYDAVSMDTDSEYDGLDQYGKYDACIRKIAMEAPLRILEEEKICGAATLGRAIRHEGWEGTVSGRQPYHSGI